MARITKEQRAEVSRMWREGAPLSRIRATTGLTAEQIETILEDTGQKPYRPGGRPPKNS